MLYNQFYSISLSHRLAPIELREQLTLNETEAKDLMIYIKDFFDVADLLVLSTCNRTEIYYTAGSSLNEEFAKLLLIRRGLTNPDSYLNYFEFFGEDNGAVNHLFEVATGLHSQVVGDMQIPNQIKYSYQWAADVNTAGPYLHRLMHTIFFANKRVAQETAFRDGAASVSYATVELAESLLPNANILVVGLGEIGSDVCKNLYSHRESGRIRLVNRTFEKAETMAAELGFEAVPIEDLHEQVRWADIVISSVSVDTPLFTRELVVDTLNSRFKYFIDLSVPRSVSADLEEIPGVLVYNVDTITNKTNQALARRMTAIPQVKSIIGSSLVDFNDWSKEMMVSPTIQKLKGALESIRKEELSRFVKGLSEHEVAILEKVTSSMMQKIIKLPVLQLKAACKRGEAETLIDVLNDLFNLEAHSSEPVH